MIYALFTLITMVTDRILFFVPLYVECTPKPCVDVGLGPHMCALEMNGWMPFGWSHPGLVWCASPVF